MLPQIVYTNATDILSKVFIGYGDRKYNIPELTKEEKKYLEAQFKKKDKNQVVFNRYDYQYIVVKIKEGQDVHARAENARNAGNTVLSALKALQVEQVALTGLDLDQDLLNDFLEGFLLGYYKFDKYKKSDENEKYALKKLSLPDGPKLKERVEETLILVKAVFFARNIINEPVSYLNAVKLADEITGLVKNTGISVEVFGKKKIEALRMGGLLAVNKGSVDPPTFTLLEWKPEGAVNPQPVVLVGKGLVYDTGGLSLKPTKGSMDEMKCDMSGAAAVAGAMFSIAANKLPVHVVALVPSTDNRPGGNAYAPGDIITMHNGLHVEVLNTDAEGRLILADALSYAKNYKPQLAITIATLTGSAVAAIGDNAIVGMGNPPRDVVNEMVTAGDEVHERVVVFPFWDEYAEELKSDVADLKNIGGKTAGAITAGKFLEKFTDFPFFHLDIAGPAFISKANAYRPKGGTGVGVRLLYRFIKNLTLTKNN